MTILDPVAIRLEILRLQKLLTVEQRRQSAQQLLTQFKEHFKNTNFTSFHTVAVYRPMGNEIDVEPVVEWIESITGLETLFCFPKMVGEEVQFVSKRRPLFSESGWIKNPLGFTEPSTSQRVDPAEIDFFLVPGVAFTQDGKRLGRGKGHYDRLLSHARSNAKKVGLAYRFQIKDDLAQQSWDQKMDEVVVGD